MDIFFQDPAAIPLPPEEVRIRELRAEIWSDNRRVRVFLEVTPFQKRPNGEVVITNPLGDEVASVSIIESIMPRMEFTMHLRGEMPDGVYHINAILYYETELDHAPDSQVKKVMDRARTSFSLGGAAARER